VIWRLDGGARAYLPRLQGPLTAISAAPADAAAYVLTQADNTIRLVRALLPSGTPSHHLTLACTPTLPAL
jgi:hypothetical protein